VVHTTPDDPSVLFEIAARSLRPGCGIVSVVEPRSPALVDRLRAHEIALLIAGSDPTVADLLALVRQWRAGSPLSPSRT
jgi:hypothetical protein